MPELGNYAGSVLGSYGITIIIISYLIFLTLYSLKKVEKKLALGAEKRSENEN